MFVFRTRGDLPQPEPETNLILVITQKFNDLDCGAQHFVPIRNCPHSVNV